MAGILSAPAGAQSLPAFNPISGTVPQSSFSVRLVDVVQVPNSSGTFPRLEQMVHAGDGSGLAYVIDQRGQIYRFDPNVASPALTPFLNVSTAVPNFNNDFQTGVRGLAFHPDFENPGTDGYRKFYTSHSRNAFAPGIGNPVFYPSPPGLNHDSVVGEWTINANGTVNLGSHREVVRIGQPRSDHNIGQIGFNPNAQPGDDDYGNLYVALGDGGGASDPDNLGQNTTFPHGSILRINPIASGGSPYQLPSGGNPIAVDGDLSDSRNLIYAYGLRNPHKFTFDTGGDGKFLVSDIGQDNIEEVNLIVPGGNYGWQEREGAYDITSSGNPNRVGDLPANYATDGFIYPVAQYDHDPDNDGDNGDVGSNGGSWAIVGGSVYRGAQVPELRGQYLFGDFGTNHGPVYTVDVDELEQDADLSNVDALNDGFLAPIEELQLVYNGSTMTLLEIIRDASGNNGLSRTDLRFGEDESGELYVLNKRDGMIRRIEGLFELGDVNQDGTIDQLDIDAMFDATAGSPVRFDVNNDQLIDDGDLTELVEGILDTRLGDLDLDGDVDGNDFGVFAANFGLPAGQLYGNGDLNNDSAIDGNDFGIFAGNFGFGTASEPGLPVPEPTTLLLSGLGLVAVLRRRRA